MTYEVSSESASALPDKVKDKELEDLLNFFGCMTEGEALQLYTKLDNGRNEAI